MSTIKRNFICVCSLFLIFALLSGCGSKDSTSGPQSQNSAQVGQENSNSGSDKSDPSAASLVADVPTTQYFTSDPVAEEDIEKILQAGVNAPSAMNGQPWHFTAITDVETIQEIADGMSFSGGPPSASSQDKTPSTPNNGEVPDTLKEGEVPLDSDIPSLLPPAEGELPSANPLSSSTKAGITDAPLVIVVSCKDGSELDAGLACQSMSVEAQLLGYGTKIISSPTIALNGERQAEYSEMLGIPKDQTAVAILLVGIEDASVDSTVDGYTSATTRNPFDEMVIYIKS